MLFRSGVYERSDGYVYARVTDGYWWSTTAGSATNGRYLGTDPTGVDPQCNYYRGSGFTVLVTSLSLSGTAASSKRSA